MSAAFLVSALIQFALALVVAWLLGPAEFGAYALALAAAILVQTLVFEWIRLSATRFHHAGDGNRLARRLTRAWGQLSGVMLVAAVLLLVFGGGRRWLFCLVPLVAVAAGFADFRAALLRAEFNQRGYALFMLLRNLLAVVMLPLAAHRLGSAEAALAAFLGALVLASGGLALLARAPAPALSPANDNGAGPDSGTLLRYAGPIIVTNCLYLALFFGLRTAVALAGGLAAAGQFSLALDFVLKLFTTVGTALDLMLFQIAVREAREKGEAAGRMRARGNGEIILAVILPMALGLFLVIPALEAFLVAPEFRGAFAGYVGALTPGIALYALIQYGLHPFQQLAHRTVPLALAALASLAVTGGLVFLLPLAGVSALPADALALGGGMIAAAALLIGAAGRVAVPEAGFLLRLLLALGALGLAVVALRPAGTGLAGLAGMIGAGMAAYAGAAYALDLASIRALTRKRIS